MEGMFNPVTILLHVVNAAILLTALYFLLLKPVRKFMDARVEKVAAELARVDEARQGLGEQQKKAEEELLAARRQAADTVAQSVTQAQEQAQKVLDNAHADAVFILKQAQVDAESMRKSARNEMCGEVAGLSVALAGKLLQREVTEKDHEKLIEDFLKKVN